MTTSCRPLHTTFIDIQCLSPKDLYQTLSESISANKHVCSLQLVSRANPNKADPQHIATSNPLVEISLSKAMMRGSCKQLISSLFAHMCLTPHSPQWVRALCSDTISSANMDHLGKKPNPSSGQPILPSLACVMICTNLQPDCPPSQVSNHRLASRNKRITGEYWISHGDCAYCLTVNTYSALT